VDLLKSLRPPLFTCWPVLTEALWLLRHYPAAIQRLLGSFEAGLLRLLVLDEDSISWIARFMHRYRNVGAQAADAALMYLAEREGIETVFTLDRRDFSVYRLRLNKSVHILPE
ncbi:MAG: type II toxin-antitoxin system VapC family toxin, partial [Burkholderiales bacterium]